MHVTGTGTCRCLVLQKPSSVTAVGGFVFRGHAEFVSHCNLIRALAMNRGSRCRSGSTLPPGCASPGGSSRPVVPANSLRGQSAAEKGEGSADDRTTIDPPSLGQNVGEPSSNTGLRPARL